MAMINHVSIQGRTALVTGASRGIGRAIALALAEAGVRVVCSGRRAQTLTPVVAELAVAAGPHDYLTMDISDSASIQRALARLQQHFGDIDILVNNAGIAESKPYHETDDDMWQRMMTVNALGVLRLSRALVPKMVARGFGRSIIVASNAGLSGYAYSSAYCASKHAVLGLMRAMALEVAQSGVTVNAVCPGWVDTEMAHQAVQRIAKKTGKGVDQARAALERMSPQRRMVSPEEVAHSVVSLCHHHARGIHGQAIVIDGGALMR